MAGFSATVVMIFLPFLWKAGELRPGRVCHFVDRGIFRYTSTLIDQPTG